MQLSKCYRIGNILLAMPNRQFFSFMVIISLEIESKASTIIRQRYPCFAEVILILIHLFKVVQSMHYIVIPETNYERASAASERSLS